MAVSSTPHTPFSFDPERTKQLQQRQVEQQSGIDDAKKEMERQVTLFFEQGKEGDKKRQERYDQWRTAAHATLLTAESTTLKETRGQIASSLSLPHTLPQSVQNDVQRHIRELQSSSAARIDVKRFHPGHLFMKTQEVEDFSDKWIPLSDPGGAMVLRGLKTLAAEYRTACGSPPFPLSLGGVNMRPGMERTDKQFANIVRTGLAAIVGFLGITSTLIALLNRKNQDPKKWILPGMYGAAFLAIVGGEGFFGRPSTRLYEKIQALAVPGGDYQKLQEDFTIQGTGWERVTRAIQRNPPELQRYLAKDEKRPVSVDALLQALDVTDAVRPDVKRLAESGRLASFVKIARADGHREAQEFIARYVEKGITPKKAAAQLGAPAI